MNRNEWLGILATILVGLWLLPGCSYRFAQIERKVCEHPNNLRTHWPGNIIDGYFIYIEGIIANPLHWHSAEHEKCRRCGQKFCTHWTRKPKLYRVK